MPCLSDDQLRAVHRDASGRDAAPDSPAHLASCASCRERLDSLAALDATLDSGQTLARAGPPTDSVAPGVSVGPYQVTRRLGAGAMGTVFAAWDPRLEREVALKVLHRDAGDLVSEARLLARLSHPNVVTVHEVLEWNGRLVLVMELARGATLRAWLAERKRSRKEVLDIFRQCAAGLAAAHAAGVVHRDFKPDNALVDETGRARLLDFGLAMPARESGASGLAGSPAYLALLQLQGAPGDARSDQYAWWASLYEALVGRRPHDGPTLDALVTARRSAPVDLSPLPLWLRAKMARGLSNEPAQRFASMDEAARAVVSPQRWLWLGAAGLVVTGALGVGAVAATPPSPCEALRVAPVSLAARAPEGPLRDAARRYASAQEACRGLPREAQPERAACLDASGRELDVALEAASLEPGVPVALRPRVLRRVLPADRCERDPAVKVPRVRDEERPALVASLRAQLRFDALRAAGKGDEALAQATQHRALADASLAVGPRAWARLNEAAALSVASRLDEALVLLRQIDALPLLEQREETWAALSRWLFECYVSDEVACQAARERAVRLTAEFDEPWARAFALEVGMRYREHSLDEVVQAWSALPGAEAELARAVANEVTAVLADDDLQRTDAVRALLPRIKQPDARLRLLTRQLELSRALLEGDLAAAQAHLRALDDNPLDTIAARRAKLASRLLLLVSARRFREALALLDSPAWTGSEPWLAHLRVMMRVVIFFELGDRRLPEAEAQAELILPALSVEHADWFDVTRARLALRQGDPKKLEAIAAQRGEDQLRAWHLAELRRDAVAARALVEAAGASAEDDPAGQRLRLEGLLSERRFAELARAAAALRARLRSTELGNQVRLLEARARWELGEREAACRVMTLGVLHAQLLPREFQRAEQLVRDCPLVGVSAWKD